MTTATLTDLQPRLLRAGRCELCGCLPDFCPCDSREIFEVTAIAKVTILAASLPSGIGFPYSVLQIHETALRCTEQADLAAEEWIEAVEYDLADLRA